jgi:hypothetical protein
MENLKWKMEKGMHPAIAIPFIILFQVVVYFASYEVAYNLWISWGYTSHKVSLWVLSLYHYGTLFVILSTLSSLLHGFNWKYRWQFSLPVYLLFSIHLGSFFSIVPYKITLVFLSSLVAYFPPLLLIEIWNTRIAKRNEVKETILDSETVI